MSSSVFITAQDTIKVLTNDKQQIIDGFGAFQGGDFVNQDWWLDLFYDDMKSSIFRVDLTPRLISPYSDLSYVSPWFMDSGTDHTLNFNDTDNPNGPEDNRVRTYTNAEDYGRDFGGFNAPIAVMGPNIDENVKYFTYSAVKAINVGGNKKKELGDFKLIGSIWSPLPWVKISSGNSWDGDWWPGPVKGAEWPFVWGGNFAGGRLDVSGEAKDVFDDSELGGEGPTSSLTQFARSTAAYIRGYQNFHETHFYAISIQNELNFEEFYNSATYPDAAQYITAIKEIRREFDKYEDLKDIKIMGPEDLLGNGAYGLWQYGSGDNKIHKNLQYLKKLSFDSEASDAVEFFCIHGYDTDGASASGADSQLWEWWLNGWVDSPAAGIPANIKGFSAYDKKSWMTETSGENPNWLYPETGYPSNGAWSLAVRIHQALTVGRQSAWIYWTFAEADSDGNIRLESMTTETHGNKSPKYVAAKHFFKYIRPNSHLVSCNTSEGGAILSSAYTHAEDSTITIVVINTTNENQPSSIQIDGIENDIIDFESYTSNDGSFWEQSNVFYENGNANINLPPYSVMTLYGTKTIYNKIENINKEVVQLFENSPNPFIENTNISFQLSKRGKVQITLHDSQGKFIDTIMNEVKNIGSYQVEIEGTHLPDGLYLCKLKAGSYENVLKLVKGKGK